MVFHSYLYVLSFLFVFREHDYDKNNKLDGLELMSSFGHEFNEHHDDETEIDKTMSPTKQQEELTRLIQERLREIEGE